MDHNTAVSTDALRPLREAVDAAGSTDRVAFARAARNAVAQAILIASLARDSAARRPDHDPPESEVHELVGQELGDALTALYRGGGDWTSRAIDLLEPLNELARAE